MKNTHHDSQSNVSNLRYIAILLGTYNGEEFLLEQLESISNQTYRNFKLFVSDDGSIDTTIDIVAKFVTDNPEISIELFDGPRRGFAQNYMWMLEKAGDQFDFYSFCDQDDVWDENKLEIAVKSLINESCDDSVPALYGSRTEIIDKNGRTIGISPNFAKKPSFSNALVQNICGGNTMVINTCLRNYLLKVNSRDLIVSHDWLSYLFATCLNGIVIYDQKPRLKYRQHDSNRVGSNLGWKSRMHRLWAVFVRRQFQKWHSMNIKCLSSIEPYICSDNKDVLEGFKNIRNCSTFGSLIAALRSGLYRQTTAETITLYMAVFMRRV